MSNRFAFMIVLAVFAVCSAASPAEAFVVDGLPVCDAAGSQDQHRAVSDNGGNTIVVWRDGRNTSTGYDIYAQKIDGDGNALWTAGGVPVCTAARDQDLPRIALSSDGGVVIVWRDRRALELDIYAQKISLFGFPMWGANGVPVCAAAGDQECPYLAADPAGGAFVAWEDGRGDDRQIYVQRVGANGSPRWAADGVLPLPLEGQDCRRPRIVGSLSSGAIVTFSTDSGAYGSMILAVSIDGDGARQVDTPIVHMFANGMTYEAASDGEGGLITVWQDSRHGGSDLYAGRILASCVGSWEAAVCTAAGTEVSPRIVSDRAGGAIVAWQDARDGNAVYAQRLYAGGGVWRANGVRVCSNAADQYSPAVCATSAGDFVVAWFDNRNGDGDIFAQSLDGYGYVRWSPLGVPVCLASGNQLDPGIVQGSSGSAVVVWRDFRENAEICDLYSVRIDESGDPVAAFLEGFSAAPGGGGIEISWTLSERIDGAAFVVRRVTGDAGDWAAIPDATIGLDDRTYRLVDTSCEPGRSYRYGVEIVEDGSARVLFETGAVAMPAAILALGQNAPNPFNPATTIFYSLPDRMPVALDVYDAAGRLVVRLVDGVEPAGKRSVVWTGMNAAGIPVPSGVYFYRLSAGKNRISRKMVLMR
ncbi:MAG: T9SS type A sorting domain-containing protein [Candidatus Krumholzibacteriota bacterium]|nr:T9SS type A sorting domain-containing protein [Candidatus Krumholzibacteriota bacterium]